MRINLAAPHHREDARMLRQHQPSLFGFENRLRQLRQEGDPPLRRGKAVGRGIIRSASEFRSQFRDLFVSREAAKSRRRGREKSRFELV